MKSKLFSVWEGVYKSFSEAKGDLDAFDSDIWIDKQKQRVIEGLKKYNQETYTAQDYPLPFIIAMLLSQKKSLKVLDFGGGMGLQYIEMISKVPDSKKKVDYYIVDSHSSINNRPVEIDQFPRLKFFYDFNDINCKFDIIHIGSTLQYIENWQDLLKSLIKKFTPTYFAFSDLLAGNIPTFVSHQLFYEKRIPNRMINIEEFQKFFLNFEFKPIYKSLFQVSILGHSKLPNKSLPKEFRLEHSLNLILKNLRHE